jgi:hypothetical protein
LLLCEAAEVGDGHGENPGVASRARELRALGIGGCRSLVVAERVSDESLADERARDMVRKWSEQVVPTRPRPADAILYIPIAW